MGLEQQMNDGGQFTGVFAGGNTTSTLYTGSGRICRIIQTGVATAAYTVYDGTQATGGKLLYQSITNGAIGTIVNLQVPVDNGIHIVGTTNSPVLCVSYNKAGSNGNA